MPLHLAAIKKSKYLKTLRKAAKWSAVNPWTNSTSQDCCIFASVKFTKKSCQMKWSQSSFIFWDFYSEKIPKTKLAPLHL